MREELSDPRFTALPAARRRAVTLLELLAVLLILGILSTIVTNVYIGQVGKAKRAATVDIIRELGVAIAAYEIDTGELPMSGSGSFTTVTVANMAPEVEITRTALGNGLLYETLVHSLSGDALNPTGPTWDGPYISLPASSVAFSAIRGQSQILDGYGRELQYLRFTEYARNDIGFFGAELFPGVPPAGASPDLPPFSPHAATETFYNPTTYQLYSLGANGLTLARPFLGAQFDDVSNY